MKERYIICAMDYDGTLIKGDSIKLYCKWCSQGIIMFIFLYHIYFRLKFLLKNKRLLKYSRVKFFYNRQKRLKLNITDFTKLLINQEFDDTYKLIEYNKTISNVYIVSASFDIILKDYCKLRGVKLIANHIDEYKPKKDVNYLQKIIELNKNINFEYSIINAYGNSDGDLDMLEQAKHSFYRKKNGKLIKC